MWVLVVKLWDEYRQGWELSVSRFSLSLDAASRSGTRATAPPNWCAPKTEQKGAS